MRFQCPGCQVSFTVPDEKLPEGKGLRVLCPKCRTPIDVQLGMRGAYRADLYSGFSSYEGLGDGEDMALVDVVEEGIKTALVCISNGTQVKRLQDVLEQMDFFVVTVSTGPFALSKIHHNRYDLVVVDESFDPGKKGENLLLHHLQVLSMQVRRQFFLCLLSETETTLDRLVAFRMGADLILNIRDLEKFKIILTRAMKEHQYLYSVYADELNRKR